MVEVAVVAGRHPGSAGDFRGLGGGQGVLSTADLAGTDLLDGGRYPDPVAKPISNGCPAAVVSGQLEAGAGQVYGVVGAYRDEQASADLVVALVPDGAEAEFAFPGAEHALQMAIELPPIRRRLQGR